MDIFETKKFTVHCWLLGKVKSHQRRRMHLISDMLFLNNSFEDKTLKKVTSLFFYGQSVITLVNLVVFILIISMIYFASWTKKNVFKPVKYKVYKSVLPYLLTLLLNKECKLYSVHIPQSTYIFCRKTRTQKNWEIEFEKWQEFPIACMYLYNFYAVCIYSFYNSYNFGQDYTFNLIVKHISGN